MKTIWHLVKKDLLRLRWAWLLWTLLLLGEIALAEFILTPRSLDIDWFRQMTMTHLLLFVGHVVLVIVLVSLTVMDDSPAGDHAFWLTRPISGLKLLAAKFGVMFLMFWLWPVLVAFPWWVYSGVHGLELLNGFTQAGMVNLAFIVPTWAVAVISRNFGRFLMVGFLISLGALVLVTVAVSRELIGNAGRGIMNFNPSVPVNLALLSFLLVIVVQYVTRLSALSKGLLATGLFGAAILIWFDPRGAWFASPVPVMTLPNGEVVQPIITETSLVISEGGDARIKLVCAVQGVPDEIALLGGSSALRLDWSDGTEFLRENSIGIMPYHTPMKLFALGEPTPDHETKRKYEHMMEESMSRRKTAPGLPPWSKPEPQPVGRYLSLEFVIPSSVAERIVVESPQCIVDFTFKLGLTKILANVPLEEGDATMADGIRLKLLRLTPKPGTDYNDSIEVVTTYAAARTVQFHRVDRQRGTAAYIQPSRGDSLALVSLSRTVSRAVLSMDLPRLWRTDQWVTDQGALARSELVITTAIPMGSTSAQVTVETLVPNGVIRVNNMATYRE